MNLEERLNKAINERNFNQFEMLGFRENPRLALLSGALIGYMLCNEEHRERIEAVEDRFNDLYRKYQAVGRDLKACSPIPKPDDPERQAGQISPEQKPVESGNQGS